MEIKIALSYEKIQDNFIVNNLRNKNLIETYVLSTFLTPLTHLQL